MSHELRTPLNAIIGFSEVLKDQLVGRLNADQVDYMTEVFNSAKHLLSLINDILDLSKVEAGKMELYLEPVNLTELFHNTLSVVKEEAHSHSITLKLKMSQSIGVFLVDCRKLKQIIFNLLSNAIKFTPDGGRVTMEVEHISNNLVVKVIDTGIGIPENQMHLLFQPFEQLDGSLSRKYEGTGLGLVVVKRIVELYGGEVTVNSCTGIGSCFSFTIPCQENSNDPPMDCENGFTETMNQDFGYETALDTSSATTGKDLAVCPVILLVEGNDIAAKLLTFYLGRMGCKVYRAHDGVEALRLVESQQPDIIIMDIVLPDVDGWEIMRCIKQDLKLENTPILVISIVGDGKNGIQLGRLNVLEKPIQKRTLSAAIRQLLINKENNPITVLLVNDEKRAREHMVSLLESGRVRILQACTNKQAIKMAQVECPDLVILELMMEEVTGFEVITALRADPAIKNISIMLAKDKSIMVDERYQLNQRINQAANKHEFDFEAFIVNVQQHLNKCQ